MEYANITNYVQLGDEDDTITHITEPEDQDKIIQHLSQEIKTLELRVQSFKLQNGQLQNDKLSLMSKIKNFENENIQHTKKISDLKEMNESQMMITKKQRRKKKNYKLKSKNQEKEIEEQKQIIQKFQRDFIRLAFENKELKDANEKLENKLNKAQSKKQKISEVKKTEHRNALENMKLKLKLANQAELEQQNQAAVRSAREMKDRYRQNKKKLMLDKKDIENQYSKKVEELEQKLESNLTILRAQESQISVLMQNVDFRSSVEEKLKKKIDEYEMNQKETQSKVEGNMNKTIQELQQFNDDLSK